MALPELHVTIIDDQDDLIMDFELESDYSVSDNEDEGSDEDPGEVGEIDVVGVDFAPKKMSRNRGVFLSLGLQI